MPAFLLSKTLSYRIVSYRLPSRVSSNPSGGCDGHRIFSYTMNDPLDSVGQGDTWYGYNLVSGCSLQRICL